MHDNIVSQNTVTNKPTLGSLFAGIGGIDLGFQRAGFEVTWEVEIDPFCRKVLAKHFPDAERFEDVRTVGKHNLRLVDVIAGGFPCQDISNAGKRAGIEGERSGLWREMHRIIGELRPRFVLVENVAALLGRGISRVCGDLAEIGYDAEWQVISASDVGAPHLRERVWIVAYPTSADARSGAEQFKGKESADGQSAQFLSNAGSGSREADAGDHYSTVAYAKGEQDRGLQFGELQPYTFAGGAQCSDCPRKWGGASHCCEDCEMVDPTGGRLSRPESESRQQGKIFAVTPERAFITNASRWPAEPNVGRVAHGIPARVDRLRSLGNSVVPQIPELIARRIAEVL